ncbi:MAG: CobW family GTP-binding protein [Psychrobacter sp.]|uniref:CobW family GTP-binding protein n=1 Tax=unclassified Psychrobacter TaxID=196806 RepID=UPI0018681743|nr:GTP-binding protein [Psychrobacter sp. FME61]
MTSISVKKPIIFQNIPCTLVTGFLGAGKTTVINELLATKPSDERWALLINEFGHIGIDGSLLASSQDNNFEQQKIAIREVSGGCICCTSQLPLQIAISRLLSEHNPQRLLIEPTGLAHPRELINQLGAPHWQTALKMQAVITVLSGSHWQQEKYRNQDGFQAHVRDADALVINRYAQLQDTDKQALIAWITNLNSYVTIIWAPDEQATADIQSAYLLRLNDQLNNASQIISKQRKINITHTQKSVMGLQPPRAAKSMSPLSDSSAESDSDQHDTDIDQPYRYHEKQQDILLAGWRLPAHYKLDAHELQNWLLKLPNWLRIKGVVNTTDGWLQINFTPDSLTTKTASVQVDSRIEMILQLDEDAAKEEVDIELKPELSATSINWNTCDQELMAMVV